MELLQGLFDDCEVQTLRRYYAGQAMRAMLANCVIRPKGEQMPRMLSSAERTLLAVQAFLMAEAMIDAEALETPELEELLKDSAHKRREA
jgi:hypothetical protein